VSTRKPRHKSSRRFGIDIHGTGGASLARRMARPRRGPRRRQSHYGQSLLEKQKAKAIYGVAEGQFRRYFEQAQRREGPTGANLLALLERRLDNVVYRLGMARTRPMARQLVNHGHVLVDDRRVDIPSFLVEAGQLVRLTDTARRMPTVADELRAGRPSPAWLERDAESAAGRVLRVPSREDVELPIDEELIVSFYSR
jgi:small subunit ribosomal protein S4